MVKFQNTIRVVFRSLKPSFMKLIKLGCENSNPCPLNMAATLTYKFFARSIGRNFVKFFISIVKLTQHDAFLLLVLITFVFTKHVKKFRIFFQNLTLYHLSGF